MTEGMQRAAAGYARRVVNETAPAVVAEFEAKLSGAIGAGAGPEDGSPEYGWTPDLRWVPMAEARAAWLALVTPATPAKVDWSAQPPVMHERARQSARIATTVRAHTRQSREPELTARLEIRTTPAEVDRDRARAAALGVTLSEYVRRALAARASMGAE